MQQTMKVGAIMAPGQASVVEVRRPIPQEDEVLVKIQACALCTWEQRVFSGLKKVPLPYLGGHEVVGEIVTVGAGVNPRWQVHDKVAVRTLAHCGECYYCRQGEDNLCEQIGKLPRPIPEMEGIGGLSEYLLAKPSQLFKLNPLLDYNVGVFSEPLACVIHSMERACLKIGNDLVIVGAGMMGLLHLMLAKKMAARVIVCEIDQQRREKAQQLGADVVLNPGEEDAVAIVHEITEGRGADAVIHTTAISAVAAQAVRMAGSMGRVILFGSFYPDDPLCLSPNHIHNSQIVLTGSVSPSSEDFLKATALLNKGIIDPRQLIQAAIGLDELQRAFELAIDPNSFRVVVRFNAS